MARVKLTEYAAKSLLIDDYDGVQLRLFSLNDDIQLLDDGKKYILKVDQGIKKRGKQGLIQLNVTKRTAKKAIIHLAEKGFDRFIAEPMFAHDDAEEKYFSIERVREGVRFLYSENGGVDIEEHPESISQFTDIEEVPLPEGFIRHAITVMDEQHLSFVEINPLISRANKAYLLDAAVLADSAGMWQASWGEDSIAEAAPKSEPEKIISELNDGSPASFSFRVLNPNGAVWLLLSGGGASITIADEAANKGKVSQIGNYGEYSGGPTREEVAVYTDAVIGQLLKSTAKRKAIVIAGGVANFTDVKKTFAGVIDSLNGHIASLKKENVKVFVRRGGPNEAEGLAMMEDFLKKHKLHGSVYGSEAILTTVIDEALEYVNV